MDQILAKAVVDVELEPTPVRLGRFAVEVWGEAPYDYVRKYVIQAKSDNEAAREGLDRFVEEIQVLLAEKG